MIRTSGKWGSSVKSIVDEGRQGYFKGVRPGAYWIARGAW